LKGFVESHLKDHRTKGGNPFDERVDNHSPLNIQFSYNKDKLNA
jgi:hypothetical protein